MDVYSLPDLFSLQGPLVGLLWLLITSAALSAIGKVLTWQRLKDWKIAVAADAIPSERYAAEELQAFLQEAGGAKLPIVERSGEGAPGVYVGPGAVRSAGGLAFDAAGFGPEDLRVSVREDGVVIAGGRPRGTLYGVYTFLEDVVGVRFLAPDQTYVPSPDDGRGLPLIEKTYRPPFRFRWSRFGEISEDHVFATRMRTNTVQTEERLGGKTAIGLVNHTFGRLMPWAEYGKEHPEYYNETDGERPREIWNDQYDPGVQLCTTNPSVKRIVAEKVLEQLAENPDLGNISVSQNDNGRKCECESCRAVDEREGTHMGSLLTLVNHVADAVARDYPGVMVGTLAYSYSRKPPSKMRPRPNVQIQLCSIECCQTHAIDDPDCPRNPSFCDDLRGWGRICDNVYVWTYVTNFHNYLLPCPNLRVLGENIRFFHRNGVKGLFMQGPAPGAEMGDLRNYIISNMIWDPTRDESTLMDEFLSLRYGKAAGEVRRYIDLVHDAAARGTQHRNCFGTAPEHGLGPEVGEKGLRIMERAMGAAESDDARKRIEKASIACHALIVEPLVAPAFQKVRSRKKERDDSPFQLDSGPAQELRPRLAVFLDLCRKHGIPRMGEWATIEEVAEVLREGYGLKEDEAF